MLHSEADYRMWINTIAQLGRTRQTRNSVTTSVFNASLQLHELEQGTFPIIQGRQIFWKGIVGELATFLQGPKSVQHFKDNGCNYWDMWGDKDGNLSVDYGNAWRNFNGVDQLQLLVDGLQNDPFGRRHIITGWNPGNLQHLSLPCCHLLYQWYVTNDNTLEMMWYQRSADWMIGVPSDMVLAGLLNLLVAQTVGMQPGKIYMQFGDTHIYTDHWEGVDTYMEQPPQHLRLPTYELASEATVFNFTPDMFKITNYVHNPKINFKLIA